MIGISTFSQISQARFLGFFMKANLERRVAASVVPKTQS
jgi:hypothetical protein